MPSKPEAERRRPGRPRRYATGRVHTAVRFSPDRYRDLKETAQAAGRSVSEEVEHRIEELATYRRAVGDLKRVGEITRSNTENVLRELGWDDRVDLRYGGRAWTRPGQAPTPKSGFIGSKQANEQPRPVDPEQANEQPRPVVTVTPAVEETLGRIVETAVAKALARAKLTIGEDQ